VAAFYKIDTKRKLVMSTASGVFTLADAFARQEKISKDAEVNPSFSQLLDFSDVTKLDIEPEDERRLAQTKVFLSQSRRAFIVSNDLAFGLARMYQVLRSWEGETGIRVFRNLDDALDWPLSKNTAT
jgi:hypothetical protein